MNSSAVINRINSANETDIEMYYYHGFIVSLIPLTILIPITVYNTTFVILAPFFMRRLRSPDNIIMGSLAVADFLVGLLTPFYLLYLHPDTFHIFRAQKWNCVLYVISQQLPMYASLFHLFIIALDRFVAITFPYFYVKEIQKSKAYTICLIVWILATVKSLVSVLFMSFDENKPLTNRCTEKDYPFWVREYVTNITVAFCLFVTCMLCIYISIIVFRQRAQIFGESRKTKYNAIFMFVFIILWFPIILYRVCLDYFTISVQTEYWLLIVENILVRLNSCVNAFIFSYSRVTNLRIYKFMMKNKPSNWNHLASSTRTIRDPGYWAPHNSLVAMLCTKHHIPQLFIEEQQEDIKRFKEQLAESLNKLSTCVDAESLQSMSFRSLGICFDLDETSRDNESEISRVVSGTPSKSTNPSTTMTSILKSSKSSSKATS